MKTSLINEEIETLLKWCIENAMEKNIFERMNCLTEEVGELAGCLNVEFGSKKHKTLKETSTSEAVDRIITAFCMFYATGGTDSGLEAVMRIKLEKWEKAILAGNGWRDESNN